MPPSVKSVSGCFTRLSLIILAENSDGLVLAHTMGHEGNLLFGTQIRSLRLPGSLDGAPDVPTAGHPLCHFISRFG
jgi:hypothetical protein